MTSLEFASITIEKGIDFILSHFDDSEPIWSRTVSTRATGGGQRLVNNPQEALAWYKASNLLDCRISAYPKYTDYYISRTGIAPAILFADIDRSQFETAELFELAATKTCTNFREILDARPTQLWTGNGYHFIQPQSAIVLEKVEEFKTFDQPSRRFMQFEEQLLTDNKADQNHCRTVSFYNCMLRVPGSLNSKRLQFDDRGKIIGDIPYEAEVRIMKYWDGNEPNIIPHLRRYYIWLQAEAISDIQRRRRAQQRYKKYRLRQRDSKKKTINWIEKLLELPIGDFRKYCIWRIFAPYFINIKGMSRPDAFNIISIWLDKCNSVSRLNFNPIQKIDDAFNKVGNYWPVSRTKLEQENNPLYIRLEKERIIY